VSRSDRTGLWDLPPLPRLPDLLRVYGRRLSLALRTHTPATVVVYDPATQTATVTVDVLAVAKVVTEVVPGVDPNAINLEAPQPPIVLTSIPVRIEGAGDGTSYLHWPIVPGATGELHVHDRSIQQWLARAAQIPVDPVAAWTHSLQDSVLYLGLTEQARRITPPPNPAAAVLEAGLIQLGANALPASRAITITDLAAFVNTILGWTPVPNDGGAALKAAVTTWWATVGNGELLGSQKVTIE
jgi:hypothetical protein